MSRIVITRHPSGDEHIVTGWDRPLDSPFVHVYDPMGDTVQEWGSFTVLPLSACMDILRSLGVLTTSELARLERLLQEHATLDYPDSNVRIDFQTPTNG